MAKITIYNVGTGEEIEREMNDEELAQYEIDQATARAEAVKKAEAAMKRSAALAKLAALGLEEDDLKALGL